jgi:DNA-binding GntR family transcriptional regulator
MNRMADAEPVDSEFTRLEEVPPLGQRVHRQLESLIISRAILPGARIVESEVAKQLGVSRGPLREALQVLAKDGYVDLKPRQGAFVHVPTEEEIACYFDVRRGMEATAVRLAATKIDADQAKRLSGMLEVANDLLEHGEDPTAHRSRVDFHAEITTIANNPLLLQLLTALKRRADWYSPPFDPADRKQAWDEHRRILDAIIAGDTPKAIELMEEHIDRARDHYVASVGHLTGTPS